MLHMSAHQVTKVTIDGTQALNNGHGDFVTRTIQIWEGETLVQTIDVFGTDEILLVVS